MDDPKIEIGDCHLGREFDGAAIEPLGLVEGARVLPDEAEIDVSLGAVRRDRDHLLIELSRAREVLRALRGVSLWQE